MPVCNTPAAWQFATDAADTWTSGETKTYASQSGTGTAFNLGLGHNASHMLQAARQAAAAATAAANSNGPEEHGSHNDSSSGYSLQIQHVNDEWFQHWPSKLLRPVPEQELRAGVAKERAAAPPGASCHAGVWARVRARLQEQGKLAPGKVPDGMQQPLPPVRLVLSVVDSRGQPVPGFDRAAFNAAKQAAKQAKGSNRKRSEAALLGPTEPVGPRRTRQRRGQ